jgi:UDPglucose 6-dehydrogenase
MNITVCGMGYVGLANALLLAQYHRVVGYDISSSRVGMLNNKISPICDKEINDFLQSKKLNFKAVDDKKTAYDSPDFVVIATPTNYDSKLNFFDTRSVESVIKDVEELSPGCVIVIKSTIPVGFTKKMKEQYPHTEIIFSPEFLREGKALYDDLYPSRIIVGGTTKRAKIFRNLLLEGALKKDAPLIYMQPTEAEAVKLFANTFLALRVAYFNELDTFAELHTLDTNSIIHGVCLDPRIGDYYNNPSFGYGGYCLPKDVRQLYANYRDIPNNLIGAIVRANKTRKDHVTRQIMKRKPGIVGVYGLAMKTGSDNQRFSAAISIVRRLRAYGVSVIIFDKSIKDKIMCGCDVTKDIGEFKEKADAIIANRWSDVLSDVKEKVYSRDLFGRD